MFFGLVAGFIDIAHAFAALHPLPAGAVVGGKGKRRGGTDFVSPHTIKHLVRKSHGISLTRAQNDWRR
ncbi:hypothetical protein [Devosia aurantiaca]|uniref:Uncharacterized protein n=1 Tax=Devosia aurantiaca TaxID=2714858 RepID=A0A6M1SL26_9HYPH|nr:hypothetical protein [Devosia aurantiaca]NGP17504.1 hypothetical protein [Devosia aurantiaca]